MGSAFRPKEVAEGRDVNKQFLKVYDAEACGMGNRIRSSGGVQLIQELAYMKLGGMNRDPETPRDGFIGSPFGEQR